MLELRNQASEIAKKRNLSVNWTEQVDQPATPLDEGLISILEAAAHKEGVTPRKMMSGAGHDAMILAPKIPSAMLFVRSPGGISHDPAKCVTGDVALALRICAATSLIILEDH